MTVATSHPARLLIVEDSPLDQTLYRRRLKDYTLEFSASGEAALARLETETEAFDLVLLDHGLPGIDGGEVLDEVRGRLGLNIPIVVVTGFGSESLAAELLSAGASDYVTKDDLNTPRIISAVTGALERHELARQRELAEAELRSQRDALEVALRQLKEAQAHLIQSEKMAGLGQLVSGVAHEINNPLAYVSNNIAVLGRDVRNIAELMNLYRAHFGENRPPDLIDAEDRIDLPYTLTNLDRLLKSSQQGLKRVREIVGSLRDFSRLDEADRKEIDPNEIIRDTLEIVRYALHRKEIDLHVERGVLPNLWCSPGKLNQVVLNILLNAVQAVEPGTRIDVRSLHDAKRKEIRFEIADQGPGIPDAVRRRIFEPFFTTKAVGVGTGLGLWVSYNIVDEHGGRIEVDTEAGKGTTFSIVIPTHPTPLS